MRKQYSTIFIILVAIIMCISKFYSNILPFILVLSTALIYIITRRSPSAGLLTYMGIFLLILLDSSYQSIVFLFFYGILGVFLGMFSHYLNKRILISILNGVILAISINGMYLTLGTSILSSQYTSGILLQCLILVFSILCSFITLIICNHIYNKFYKKDNLSNIIK